MLFDVEEFDMPLEYGFTIPSEKQFEIGFSGLEAITPLLNQSGFSTAHLDESEVGPVL